MSLVVTLMYRFSQASGSDSTRKEAEAEADDWSDRRRLVEKWDEYDEARKYYKTFQRHFECFEA